MKYATPNLLCQLTFREAHILIKDLYELQQIEELVERIDKLRVEHNYSIYELAVKSGLSFNTIKYLYKKKSFPNVKTLYSICEGFEIPVWMLFYKRESCFVITKSEYILIDNYEKLSDVSKRLLLELSEKLK